MTRTRRRPYRKSRRFDKTCRNHGACPWCRKNRQYSDRKRRMAAAQAIKEWRNERKP